MATATGTAPKGLAKPLNLSPELVAIVGEGPMPRTMVTKKIWDYIKANNLQDSSDKRMVKPDAKLGKVLGSEPIHMMKMAGALSKHLS
jgi:chromatin remodeling complex protein RSC6